MGLARYLPDAAATEALGGDLARALPAACLVYLRGNLGAGKTTVVRGLLRRWGHTGGVRSPTYTLIEPYCIASRSVFHLDLYRLSDPEELEFVGLRDLFAGDAVVLVEWPERGAGRLPVADLELTLGYAGAAREAKLEAAGDVGVRVLEALELV